MDVAGHLRWCDHKPLFFSFFLICKVCCDALFQGCTNFLNIYDPPSLPGARRVTWIKFHTEELQVLCTSHTKFSHLVYLAPGICPLLCHCLKFVIFDVTDNKLTPQWVLSFYSSFCKWWMHPLVCVQYYLQVLYISLTLWNVYSRTPIPYDPKYMGEWTKTTVNCKLTFSF
jgi:hypothetical protein